MSALDAQHRPVSLDLDRSRELRIRWADGFENRIPVADLRRACPCATCRAAREESAHAKGLRVLTSAPKLEDQTTVSEAQLAGNYALRISWKDGHDTGIYEFRLLRSLGVRVS